MSRLKQIVQTTNLGLKESSKKAKLVTGELLSASDTIKQPNFNQLAQRDLQILFHEIDEHFFGGCVQQHLQSHRQSLTFRVSRRMTNSGGITTTKFAGRTSRPTDFEIAISSTLLFESFKDQRPIFVTGLLCGDRTRALQRIMEHEMIHLIEMLLWHESSCARARFQNIAYRFFRHRQSTHQLITPSDTAESKYNIATGDWVEFNVDRKKIMGFVNRITKRATVLVPSREGTKYNDGKKYVKYYVPVHQLRKAV